MVCKILVVGDMGTGKTSLIKRYVHGIFSQHYKATIGVDFALKVLKLSDGSLIRLQLWDIAGQERFGNMTRIYYKDAIAAFIVFDVTRNTTFDSVKSWKKDIDDKINSKNKIPVILIANKIDLLDDKEILKMLNSYCRDHGFMTWFTTSAKENIDVDEICDPIIRFIEIERLNKEIESLKINDNISIDINNDENKITEDCC